MVKILPKETGEICPNCGEPMVEKRGRYGDFEACSNFPDCKYIKGQEDKIEPISTGVNYPKCKYPLSDKPTGNICFKCGLLMVMEDDKEICSDKKCK